MRTASAATVVPSVTADRRSATTGAGPRCRFTDPSAVSRRRCVPAVDRSGHRSALCPQGHCSTAVTVPFTMTGAGRSPTASPAGGPVPRWACPAGTVSPTTRSAKTAPKNPVVSEGSVARKVGMASRGVVKRNVGRADTTPSTSRIPSTSFVGVRRPALPEATHLRTLGDPAPGGKRRTEPPSPRRFEQSERMCSWAVRRARWSVGGGAGAARGRGWRGPPPRPVRKAGPRGRPPSSSAEPAPAFPRSRRCRPERPPSRR